MYTVNVTITDRVSPSGFTVWLTQVINVGDVNDVSVFSVRSKGYVNLNPGPPIRARHVRRILEHLANPCIRWSMVRTVVRGTVRNDCQ